MPAFRRPRFVALASALALSSLRGSARADDPKPDPAAARTVYDGNWSVLIVTDSGPCDRAYRYGLSIRDGSVIYQGSGSVNVAGRVYRNGEVDVRVWAGPQGAHGYGRLSRRVGGGVWRGTGLMGACGGRWSAERR